MRGVFQLWLVLVLALNVSAADVLVREQITRPVYPHWADLGSAAFPFRTVYTDVLVAGQTNIIGGGGGEDALVFTNTQTLAPGTPAYAVLWHGIAGIYQLGIPQGSNGATGATGATGPAGPAGTNTITAYNLSNAVLSSAKIVLTNLAAFNLTGSNYIGRFSQAYQFRLTLPSLGGGGATPGTNPTETVYLSLNGSNGWFAATNVSPLIFTNVSVAIVGANIGTNAAAFTLYGVDHPELVGRTNSFEGQHYTFPTPTADGDAATLGWVNGQIANAQNLFTSTVSNNLYRLAYTRNGSTLWDISSSLAAIAIDSFTLDGTGANAILQIATTNLSAGYLIEANTNLVYFNNWATFTNYTITTNSGEVSFTIPVNFSLDAQFFRARASATNAVTVYQAPFTVNNGSNNVASFSAQTNTPALTDWGSGKGGRFWVSNGFAYFTGSTNGTTIYTRALAP